MTPALGDSWSHACSTRVIMNFCSRKTLEESVKGERGRQLLYNISLQNEHCHKYRSLTMIKSPRYKTPSQTAIFRVTSDGIRDAA